MKTEDDITRERELADIAEEARGGDGLWNGSTRHMQRQNTAGGPAAMALVIMEKAKEFLVPVLLSLSLIGNVVMFFSYRSATQETDLKRYDLDFFKENDWATFKAEVETDHALIQAYGLQEAVKRAAKEK
jgi:hypothetical protein